MKAVIVQDKNTKKLVPFTIGSKGEVIITSNREYDLDNLIVSLVQVSRVRDLDCGLYVIINNGSYGQTT